MKVLILSDINSAHTRKWAIELSKKGINIGIFSLSAPKDKWFENNPNIEIFSPVSINLNSYHASLFNKIKYIRALSHIKRIIKVYKPDILHSHYASSYGLLGALAKFHPFIISVWGSDVFDFPKINSVTKKILKYNLSKSDTILSTSHIMAKETTIYTDKNVEVIPFGVDLERFKPLNVKSIFNENDIVIGNIKSLEAIYGIEYLIKAFKILTDKYSELPLKLLIIGDGSRKSFLLNLVNQLKLNERVTFTGQVKSEDIPLYHNMITIFACLSLKESFGVAVVEASSCEKPVVVSDVGGLPEVVDDGITGLVVPVKNYQKAADAIERLILDNDLALRLGKNGRKRVIALYNLKNNVSTTLNIYNNLKLNSKS
jgi:L-malate glycosyltransferase